MSTSPRPPSTPPHRRGRPNDPRRRSRLAASLAIVGVVVALAACASGATPSAVSPSTASGAPSAATSPMGSDATSSSPDGSTAPSPSDAASPSPDGSTPSGGSPGASASAPAPSPSVGQTDTEWGRIWDAVPQGFPAYPGSTTTEIGRAASDQRVVKGSVGIVATWYQAALEGAGYSTETLSGPFEDGSMVLDSVGEPLSCRTEIRIVPQGELIVIDVLFGAACPFS